MYSIANKVGRLVELTIVTPVTIEEAHRAFLELRACIQAVGGKIAGVADLTAIDIFAPEVADKLTQLMRSHNAHMERSAFLIGDAPTFGLQFMRMIREAGNPARRIFKRRAELESWLGEILTPEERERVHAYLDERGVARTRLPF
ncbi:hypothetical protein [Pendulispora albinea]|uniref:STAS/SEC14 domain-containing protein n=1 Tax=Pendulispora albinea TaxID=2741071 RepID=A0ABZ2LK97_9BACT